MKFLFTTMLIAFSFSVFATDVTYPVKNFKYLQDADYRDEVQDSDKYVVMVFSSKDCLERTIIDRSCWLFEKKFDYFVPKFSSSVKVVGFNTYFENYQTASYFQITKRPTVIIIKNNQIIKRFEPSYAQADINQGRLGWQDELLKDVIAVVQQIR